MISWLKRKLFRKEFEALERFNNLFNNNDVYLVPKGTDIKKAWRREI